MVRRNQLFRGYKVSYLKNSTLVSLQLLCAHIYLLLLGFIHKFTSVKFIHRPVGNSAYTSSGILISGIIFPVRLPEE